jgi:hypothetical protein
VSLVDNFNKIANAHLARISQELGDAIEYVRTHRIDGVYLDDAQLTEYAQVIAGDAEIAVEFTPW